MIQIKCDMQFKITIEFLFSFDMDIFDMDISQYTYVFLNV